MNRHFLIILLVLFSVSCTTIQEKETLSQNSTPELMRVNATTNDLPQWLLPTVNELATMSAAAQIIQCTYHNETVYYVPSAAFHKRSVLYKADGTILCHPDGGIMGKDSRCPDFHNTKTNVNVVWSNQQKL